MLPTPYQQLIHLSRYARWDEEAGRREDYDGTVDRYFDFFIHYIREHHGGVAPQEYLPLKEAVRNLDVLPSMRCLMAAGPALARDHMAGYNCGYRAINDVRAFDEILFTLMCTVGVGFSVERQYVTHLPTVPERLSASDVIISVRDSKRGWAESFRAFLGHLYEGRIPQLDTSKLRKRGSRLKTMGGTSSGPQPLIDLCAFAVTLFQGAVGRKLSSLECHDLVCMIGICVVVGGVRRSALLSLSNLSDQRMRDAKSGEWYELTPWRRISNNSVAYTETPEVGQFMEEWLALYQSKSGERGIFNRGAAHKQATKSGRRKGYLGNGAALTNPPFSPNPIEFGTNPCLHPNSQIETIHGQIAIKDITEPTMVYTMDDTGRLAIRECSASWVSKKDTPTITIRIASGKAVTCTPDHKIYVRGRGWIEAQDIHIGDKVVHLVRNRRGAAYSGVKLTTQNSRDFCMEHRLVWESYHGLIPLGYDIHHTDGDTYNNDIDNLECLSHEDHCTLTALEQPNSHMVTGYHGKGITGYGFVSPATSRHGQKIIVPMPEELKSNLHQYATVVSMEQGPVTDVYDLTVEDTHNFIADFVVVHNCSEILLRDRQLCNLSSVVVQPRDTLDDLARKVRIATILGTWQSCLTKFRYVTKAWQNNCEEERLLGVSMTNIMSNPLLNGRGKGGLKALGEVLDALKQVAIDTNKEWAERLGIPQSVAITCVKPEGNGTQLAGVHGSGIHPVWSEYHIRRVRELADGPVTAMLLDEGFHGEIDVHDSAQMVFSFPKHAPKQAVFRQDMTAIEQLEHWKVWQDHWCEHKPSITVYVREAEWPEVGGWVYKHFDTMSGVSFLPYSDHVYKQAPYEEITKARYEELMFLQPVQVDLAEALATVEQEDNTVGSQELSCVAGHCEI